MTKVEKQDNKIIDLLASKESSTDPLTEGQLENFAKSLLIFSGKSDNYTGKEKSCQVASLDDLKTGHTLKIKKKEQQSGLVINFDKKPL